MRAISGSIYEDCKALNSFIMKNVFFVVPHLKKSIRRIRSSSPRIEHFLASYISYRNFIQVSVALKCNPQKYHVDTHSISFHFTQMPSLALLKCTLGMAYGSFQDFTFQKLNNKKINIHTHTTQCTKQKTCCTCTFTIINKNASHTQQTTVYSRISLYTNALRRDQGHRATLYLHSMLIFIIISYYHRSLLLPVGAA